MSGCYAHPPVGQGQIEHGSFWAVGLCFLNRETSSCVSHGIKQLWNLGRNGLLNGEAKERVGTPVQAVLAKRAVKAHPKVVDLAGLIAPF